MVAEQELNELNRLEGTSFSTLLDQSWTTMAEEAIRTMQQQFTSALDGSTKQNSELQAELAQSRQSTSSTAGVTDGRSGRGHKAVGKARRLLGLRMLGWIGGQSPKGPAGAAVPRLEKLTTEAAKALLDDAHDSQGSSSEDRVSGG